MAALNRLVDTKIRAKMAPRRYGDGGGLYLQVGPTGSKSWFFRYRVGGREREMGLGAYPDVSLALAREKAEACRKMRASGIDPIDARAAAKERERIEAAHALTFKQCAQAYINAHEAGWRNPKHRDQWRNTLASYVYPVLGDLPVQTVDTALVSKVLEPIWHNVPETAGRVRGRIEAVLDWAKVRGYRDGENPARWRGHFDKLLPALSKVRAVEHHAALPFEDINAFILELREREALAALALEFLILTAARTSEVLNAQWSEINASERVWVIPAARMKAKREHRVPLTVRALKILEKTSEISGGKGYVFPGAKKGKPLSNMALLILLRRMKRGDLTVHGFRSSFRDWAAECTSFPRDVAEMALAHAVSDKVEAAYRRGDLFAKRRHLMEAWEAHCMTAQDRGAVIPFVARSA